MAVGRTTGTAPATAAVARPTPISKTQTPGVGVQRTMSKTSVPAPIQPGSSVSFDPATFTQGGLIDDVDVIIADAACLLWDYNGTQPSEVPALGITFHIIGENPPVDHDQYYSAGKAEDFIPSDDGSTFRIVGSKTGLNVGSNAGLFIASLINCGVPLEYMTGNVKQFVGVQLHVQRVPAPKRSGANMNQKEGATVLVATKLLALPGEQAGQTPATVGRPAVAVGGKVNGAAIAAVPASTEGGVSDELFTLAADTVTNLLIEAGGTLPRKMIGAKVFAALKGVVDAKTQAAAMKLAFSEEFLGTAPGITFDGTNVSLGG